MIVFSRFDTVEVFDETLPIAFNMRAIADFEDETKITLFELLQIIGTGQPDRKIIPLIWFALVQGYQLRDGKKPPFEKEVLDSMDLDVLMAFVNKLTEAIEKMTEPTKKQIAAKGNKKRKANTTIESN